MFSVAGRVLALYPPIWPLREGVASDTLSTLMHTRGDGGGGALSGALNQVESANKYPKLQYGSERRRGAEENLTRVESR